MVLRRLDHPKNRPKTYILGQILGYFREHGPRLTNISLYDYQKLLLNNFSLQRFSEDASPVNNYGYKQLDFCKKK